MSAASAAVRARRLAAGLLALAGGVAGGVLAGAGAADAGRPHATPHRRAVLVARGWHRTKAVPGALGGRRRVTPTTTAPPVTVPTTTTDTTVTTGATAPPPPPTTTTTTGTTTTPPPAPLLRTGAQLTEYAVGLSRPTLDAGTIEVTATNFGMDPHNLALRRSGSSSVLAQTPTILPQDADTLTATVTAGTYVLFCTLYDHDAQGMHATLTVR